MAFAELEPFGDRRSDVRAALVACTVANTARNPKRRRQPYKLDDFMLRFRSERRRQPWEEQLRFVEMLNAAMGGRDLRSKD